MKHDRDVQDIGGIRFGPGPHFRFNRKLFFILWIASVFGVVAVIPYALTLQAPLLEKTDLPLPLETLIPLQVAANALILGLVVAAGLWLAARTGLGAPLLENWLEKSPPRYPWKEILFLGITVGIISAVLIALADYFLFEPRVNAQLSAMGIPLPETLKPPAWQGFLASFYGGITEEIFLRLFFLTLLAWLGSFVHRDREGRPTHAVLWIATILAAVAFGLGHLPATAAAGLPLTPLIITRALVLNGVVGMAAGWLYWSFGLESAMIAHFSADIILHVILGG